MMKQQGQIRNSDKIRFRWLYWTLVILWMIVIFLLSHQSGIESSSLSSGLTQLIWEWLDRYLPMAIDMHTFHFLVRKAAHFTAYAILGMLTYFAVRIKVSCNGDHRNVMIDGNRFHDHAYMQRLWNQKEDMQLSNSQRLRTFAYTLLICVLYAISDEFHQYFVPGRSAEVRDVIIDSCGALAGLLFCVWACNRVKGKSK